MEKTKKFLYSQSPLIQFGPGVRSMLGRQAKFLNVGKPLVVTDPGVRDLGILDEVLAFLAKAEVPHVTFTGVDVNPTEANVKEGLSLYEQEGCDAVIAVGGGSALDAGKAIRLFARCGGAVSDYDVTRGGLKRIPSDLAPMIAIPTTAGTGSEVTNVTVVSIPEQKAKISIIGPSIPSTLALVDPELSAGMPAALTAATGMDALAHCVESFCAPRFCPIADQTALGGMECVTRSLVRAVQDGSDLEARSDMALAALFGGLTFPQKGVGAAHALSHALTAFFGVLHGLANAILLPHVMERNLPAIPDTFLAIARRLDPASQAPEDAVTFVGDLVGRLGIPTRLSEVGVQEAAFAELADHATRDVSLSGNPIKLDAAELEKLLRKAF